jgi:hypothetical protein
MKSVKSKTMSFQEYMADVDVLINNTQFEVDRAFNHLKFGTTDPLAFAFGMEILAHINDKFTRLKIVHSEMILRKLWNQKGDKVKKAKNRTYEK